MNWFNEIEKKYEIYFNKVNKVSNFENDKYDLTKNKLLLLLFIGSCNK